MPETADPKLLKAAAAPRDACRLAADALRFADDAAADAPHPVRMRVRSRDAVEHWFWYGGRVYHDFAGLTMHKTRLAIDYVHGEEIGYLEGPETDDEGLWLSGAIVPTSGADDPAPKVIQRGKGGVPYEASIYFDGPMRAEYLDEGVSAEVNGQTVDGPCTILREWTLRGVAVCPHGRDGDTATEFSRGQGGDVPVVSLDQNTPPTGDPSAMSKTAPAGDAGPTDDQPTEQAQTPATPPAEQSAGAEPEATADPPAEQSAGEPPAQPTAADEFRAELLRFSKTFGEIEGPKLFADGVTFAEALEKDHARLSAENGRLRQRLSGQQAADDEGLGESEPGEQSARSQSGRAKKSPFRFASGHAG